MYFIPSMFSVHVEENERGETDKRREEGAKDAANKDDERWGKCIYQLVEQQSIVRSWIKLL